MKKILTVVVCGILTLNLSLTYSENTEKSVHAKTIAELQQERADNEAAIAELEAELAEYEADRAEEEAYQETLSEQIQLMQNNIAIVDEELNRIKSDIYTAESNIEQLNKDIAQQEIDIANNTELFKERLRAMYVTGNDSLASAVIGSTDFYDMLSRVEMVNRIAEHDNELIETLKTQLETLDAQKSALESEKLTLEMKQSEQENKRAELNEQKEEYNAAFEKSQEYLDFLALEASGKEQDIAELEAANEAKLAEEEKILAEIKRQEELRIQKEKEEQERLEQERLEQERLEQERLEAENNSSSDDYEDDYYEEDDDYSSDTSYDSGGFIWPSPGGYYVSSYFGYRWGKNHNGIDIAGGGIRGTSAVASRSGTVILVSNSCSHDYPKDYTCGCGGGYGNYVVIDHGDSYSTYYAHMSSVYVSVGEYVSQGQAVGSVGCTGHSTGNHLHFEIRSSGSPVDPMNYLN